MKKEKQKVVIKNYLELKINNIPIKVFLMKVKDVIKIHYVARRGDVIEEGAVQRTLIKSRIESIKQFIIKDNMFFNAFILNWTNKKAIKKENKKLLIPIIKNSAQVLDGQHRLAGLEEAIKSKENIGDKEIIVIMAENLSTKDAASIFLNINAQQVQVNKSLVYDLFGESDDVDSNIYRARDIAQKLNEDKDSPYYDLIRIPVGSKKDKNQLELSIVVNSLKQYTDTNGMLYQFHLTTLETQYRAILNFLNTIAIYYKKNNCWTNDKSPFLIGAGFNAAIEFFMNRMLPLCNLKKSFEPKVLSSLLKFDNIEILLRKDIKNIQGKEQRKRVNDFLNKCLIEKIEDDAEYKF